MIPSSIAAIFLQLLFSTLLVLLRPTRQLPSATLSSPRLLADSGGCHCKNVRWQVEAPQSVVVWQCNCSNCSMRGNIHFIVPSSNFKLIGDSEQYLTTYTFGSHIAKHMFCKICGITSFYMPRSNPDGIAVAVKCVDDGTISNVELKLFDGRNWEKSYEQSSISAFSKLDGDSVAI